MRLHRNPDKILISLFAQQEHATDSTNLTLLTADALCEPDTIDSFLLTSFSFVHLCFVTDQQNLSHFVYKLWLPWYPHYQRHHISRYQTMILRRRVDFSPCGGALAQVNVQDSVGWQPHRTNEIWFTQFGSSK